MADIFQGNFQKRDEEIKKLLRIEDSFDLIRRRFVIGGRQAAFYTVDGFLKGEVSEKVMEFFYKITSEQMPEDFADFLQQEIPYLDLMKIADQEAFVKAVLSGMSCLLVEGYDIILALDFREYPGRCSTGYLQQTSGSSERKRCSVYRRYQWSSPHGCTEVSSIPDQAKHG